MDKKHRSDTFNRMAAGPGNQGDAAFGIMISVGS